ncbi:MAG: RluA family pseudouridine synthase [Sphaerochaetaceae bacterium]
MNHFWQMVVPSDSEEMRVDTFVVQNCLTFNRSLASSANTLFFIDNKEVKKSKKVKEGQLVEVKWVEEVFDKIEAEDIPLNIIYEDQNILVINKEQGKVVHPAAGNWEGTIVNALVHRYQSSFFLEEGQIRPGIVHRLDKETSGIMVIALNKQAHENISKQFKDRVVVKEYVALVKGVLKQSKLTIDKNIGRDRFNRKKFTTVDSSKGKEAISNVTLLRQIGEYALVKVNIITGRTHQIRVHLSSLNYPIVGDPLYSRTKGDMMLHALSLQFNDPVSGKKLTFRAPLPKNFVERVKSLSDNTRM